MDTAMHTEVVGAEYGVQNVKIVDVDISITNLAFLLVKLALASIPASIIIAFLYFVIWYAAWALLGGTISAIMAALGHHP